MRILFLMNSGFDTLGPSNHLLESIIKRLLENDHHIHIIEKNTGGRNPSVPVSILNEKLTFNAIKSDQVIKTSFIKRYLNDIQYAFKCIKFYKDKRNYDVVFLQSCNVAIFHVFLLKLFVNAPIIFNVQDIFPVNASMGNLISSRSIIYRILRFLQLKSYQYSDEIVTISDDMKKTLIDEGVATDKVSVVYNWSYSDKKIDIKDSENIFIKKYGIDVNEYKIVYAGNIGILQNVDIIIEAASKLKKVDNLIFYIIGDGAYRKKLTEKVKASNLENVKFLPMQDPKYATHIYSMADVNIIPLKKGIIKVALPSKTATCLATSKPIIACVDENSAFSKIIRQCDKCAVVDSDNPESLSKQILEFYSKNIRTKSENAYDIFDSMFSKEKNTKKYVDIIEKIKN
ncbi:glycosyltransferase family 4 protein [Alkalibacter rhizosphaerae]|uniref:Glycosyltransferase family 4 protein n=1 Tax=Alkalibacter rhizosphaerae TaxID=2815577 RepID=A0A975AIN4_9FIRM|nr:glycosyltransferase family 4 protein [Alkalibacter rhizosphaerae]QSX09278.1 glycosyltransferase family 4 protein [Alkalibacter rhizosphaerae]